MYAAHILMLCDMNRNHLALFHLVAQAGGISRGAEQAHVSQPAVSKQIRELEESLGVKLLERLPRGSRLTEAGRLLADYTRRFAILEQDAARAIEEFRGLKRGRLTIGASTTIGAYLLPQVLGAFHKQHPDIELQLEIANTRVIQDYLVEGRIEMGLTEGLIRGEQFNSEVFDEDELVAIAPRGHPLLKRGPVTARELCREPVILREEGSGTRAVVERALGKLGIAVHPVLSLAGTEAIKRAVVAGIGVAILSRLAIGCELQFGALAVIPIKDLVIRRRLHLQRMQGRSESPALVEFRRILAFWKAHRPEISH
jgi:DNA-binding transcriptional LysR family regulator